MTCVAMDVFNIPQIEFYKRKGALFEFEVVPLEKILSRQGTLNHELDKPHRVHFHNIVYITQGEGRHYIDFQSYGFSPGSLIFISKGQVHSFDVQPEIGGHVVIFTKEFLEKNLIHCEVDSLYRLYNQHLHAPVIPPRQTEEEGIPELISEINREYFRQDPFAKEEILRSLLKVLLLKTERIKQSVNTGQKNTEWLILFGRFKEYLENHIASTRSVKDFAAMLRISTKHLNTVCKAISGSTAKQYIDDFLTLEIKRFLVTSDSSVQEISFNFGFEEPTNFVKYFKKHSGVSPAKFRKTYTSLAKVSF